MHSDLFSRHLSGVIQKTLNLGVVIGWKNEIDLPETFVDQFDLVDPKDRVHREENFVVRTIG